MGLEIVSLHNHGDADQEYVKLRTTGKVNMHDYIVFDDSFDEDHHPSNIHRHMYWFPKALLDAGWEIYLYTREGSNGSRSGRKIYNFYWNSKRPIWNDEGDTAYLIKIDVVDTN
jgi:hypothetical protein